MVTKCYQLIRYLRVSKLTGCLPSGQVGQNYADARIQSPVGRTNRMNGDLKSHGHEELADWKNKRIRALGAD